MKIVTYNINGIRASGKKGLLSFIESCNADIYCFQESRATEQQILQELNGLNGYEIYMNVAEKKGYSGTVVLTKQKPINVYYSVEDIKNDTEGRILFLEFDNFNVINLYTPNGGTRLEFKLEFMNKFLNSIKKLIKNNKEIIICTDFNIAHTPLDLSHPKECAHVTGYLKVERELFKEYLDAGLFDTFREYNPTAQAFSWSSYRSKIANNSWGYLYRFDYIFTTKLLLQKVVSSHILYDVNCSDHYPVLTEFDI